MSILGHGYRGVSEEERFLMRHLLLLGYFNIYGLAIHFLLGRLGVTALPQLLITFSTQV